MANSPPPDPPGRGPKPELRFRSGLDYVLVVPTCLLLLAHAPVLAAIPRMLGRHLNAGNPFRGADLELDLLWAVPLALLCACLWMLARWKWFGITPVGRIAWAFLLLLAMLAYPAGFMAAMALNPAHTWRY